VIPTPNKRGIDKAVAVKALVVAGIAVLSIVLLKRRLL
jgi:hypothetical protein